eukprot:6460075-Amphidinium_carterae.1
MSTLRCMGHCGSMCFRLHTQDATATHPRRSTLRCAYQGSLMSRDSKQAGVDKWVCLLTTLAYG